jgi:hypothetical protein
LAADAACFCAAWRGERLVGVVGAEFDVTLGRAWLRGPLVADEEPTRTLPAPVRRCSMHSTPRCRPR